MVAHSLAADTQDAVRLGNQLVLHGLLQHESCEHVFSDGKAVYFRLVGHAGTANVAAIGTSKQGREQRKARQRKYLIKPAAHRAALAVRQ